MKKHVDKLAKNRPGQTAFGHRLSTHPTRAHSTKKRQKEKAKRELCMKNILQNKNKQAGTGNKFFCFSSCLTIPQEKSHRLQRLRRDVLANIENDLCAK